MVPLLWTAVRTVLHKAVSRPDLAMRVQALMIYNYSGRKNVMEYPPSDNIHCTRLSGDFV